MAPGLQTRNTDETVTHEPAVRVLIASADVAMVEECAAVWNRAHGSLLIASGEAAWQGLRREAFDAVLVERDPSGQWTEDVFATCSGNAAIVVVVEGEEQVRRAVEHGADAVLRRPFGGIEAVALLTLAAESRRLRRRVRALESRLTELQGDEELVGCSPAIRRLASAISRAGENDATVLIEGPGGAGKTLVARRIHATGRRAAGPLEVLRSEGTDEPGLESALRDAQGGTLVLEDVERLPMACQSRLVRYLKDHRQGARQVRIVATTSARLAELTARGGFREDLYYRLNMFPVVVPALQERREDIPLLTAHFLAEAARTDGLPDKGFTTAAMIMLEAHPWPGNVAQLRNAIARAHGLAEGGQIDRVHLFGPSTGVHPPPGVKGLTDAFTDEQNDSDEPTEADILPFHEEEKRLLTRALQATHGNVRRAAQLLGIGRATLYRKIQVFQLRLQ